MIEVLIYTIVSVLCVLAAAFLVYWLRGRVLEHRLALLEAVADLSQRIVQLEHTIHASDPAPIERKLDALTNRMKDIDARIAMIASEGIQRMEPALTGEETVEEIVADALERIGCSAVSVISERALDGGSREVRVEAQRQGVTVKGSVFLNKNFVAETRLTPVYECFP